MADAWHGLVFSAVCVGSRCGLKVVHFRDSLLPSRAHFGDGVQKVPFQSADPGG